RRRVGLDGRLATAGIDGRNAAAGVPRRDVALAVGSALALHISTDVGRDVTLPLYLALNLPADVRDQVPLTLQPALALDVGAAPQRTAGAAHLDAAVDHGLRIGAQRLALLDGHRFERNLRR